MLLTPKHLQIIRDVHRFSRIRRYHNMLPWKHALFYDPGILEFLEDKGLIEEGTVVARCGSERKGYRLTKAGRKALKQAEEDGSIETGKRPDSVDDEGELGPDHLEVLQDMYHFSLIKKYNGVTPKVEIEEFDKKVVKVLYDLGYILYIKLKGQDLSFSKGYILTDKAMRLLRHSGFISKD